MLTSSDIFDAAKSLPHAQRAELAHALLLSLEPDDEDTAVDEAWAEEALRRSESIRSGTVALRDWEDVHEEVRNSIRSPGAE